MLNPKQKRFCEEYIIDCNATQAYIRAGYDASSANANGNRMILKDSIKEYIAFLQAEVEERTKVTLDSVVFRINAIADGSEEDNTQLKALDMLMKHLGGYAVEIAKNTEPLRVQVERIDKR